MQQLISIKQETIGENSVQAVNARELHAFLESKQDFSTWIKSRIDQYGFVEDQDYGVHKIMERQNQGLSTGQGKIEYFPSIDMAKELAMVERNAKGKEARQYFIECERRAKSVNPANLSRIQLIQMAMEAEQERLVLEEKVAKIQPMADALLRIAYSDGGKCLMDAAKVLQQRPRAFIADLCVRGWIFRRAGVTNWIGYQDKINALYLEHKLTSVERPDGSTKNYSQVLVTPRGIAKLAMIYGVEPLTEAV